jgi:hypothetical protein
MKIPKFIFLSSQKNLSTCTTTYRQEAIYRRSKGIIQRVYVELPSQESIKVNAEIIRFFDQFSIKIVKNSKKIEKKSKFMFS